MFGEGHMQWHTVDLRGQYWGKKCGQGAVGGREPRSWGEMGGGKCRGIPVQRPVGGVAEELASLVKGPY